MSEVNLEQAAASLEGQIARNSAFYFSARVFGAGSTYLAQLLLARWMGDEELGRYVAAFSWCLVLSNIAVLGFPPAALRFVSKSTPQDLPVLVGFLRRARQFVSGASVVLALLIALAIVLVFSKAGERGSVFTDSGVGAMLIAMLCVPILSSIVLHCGVSLALGWQKHYALPHDVLRPVLFLAACGVSGLLSVSLDAIVAMWIHAGCMLLIGVAQLFAFQRNMRAEVARIEPRYETETWVTTALPLMVVALYGHYFLEFNVIFLDAVLSPDLIGVLGASHRTAFLIGFALLAVDAASLPRLSHWFRQGDLDGLQAELTRATKLKSTVSLIAFTGLAVLGQPVLALFGPSFVAGYPAMMMLAGGLVVRALIGPAAELLGVTGHQRVSLLCCLAGLIAAPVFDLVLATQYGLVGAACAIVLVLTLCSLWLHIQVRNRLGVDTSILSIWTVHNRGGRA